VSTIFSTKKGQGNPLILLHGFCETHKIWEDIVDSLAINNSVFCLDLPGFGKSAMPENEFSISVIATQIIEWIKENRIENPILIGHSLGGYIALEIARQNSIKLKGLVLFHSTAQADTQEKKANRNKVIDFVSKNGAEAFLANFVPSLFYKKDNFQLEKIRNLCAATKAEAIIRCSSAMRDRSNYLDLLKIAPFPILFLCGEYDSFISGEDSRNQSISCINSTLIFLSNTAHLGMIENPTDSIKALNRFIEKCFS
jgi:pimeloyl-ACP methyl ester carboxylesterase